MRGLLKRAALALLTTGVTGLPYAALAQGPVLPQPIPSMPSVPPPLIAEEIIVPRVVAPETPAPNQAPPNAQIYPAVRKPPKVRTAVFGADQTPKPVDLLAPPTEPSGWAVDTLPASSLQTQPATVLAVERHDTATVSPIMTPAAMAERAASANVIASPKKTTPNWATQRPFASVKTNAWPAAFVEHERPHTPELKPVASRDIVNPEASAPLTGAPNAAAQLQQDVARTCGNLAKDVKVVSQPDLGVTIRVQAVNASAERELLERLLKLPALAEPNVHLELDTTR